MKHWNLLLKYFTKNSSFLFLLIFLGWEASFSQSTKINISTRAESYSDHSVKMILQSMDGMATCIGDIEYVKSGESFDKITITFSACEKVLPKIAGTLVFSTIQWKEGNIIWAENDLYNAAFAVENNILKLDNISSKTKAVDYIWNFLYQSEIQLKTYSEPKQTAVLKKGNESKTTSFSEATADNEYVIKKDDYIYKIARELNCSPSFLMKENNIKSNDILYPGQKIKICSGAALATSFPSPSKPAEKTSQTYKNTENDFNRLTDEITRLTKEYKTLNEERTSLKFYSEDLKKEFESLIKDYNAVKKSYESLMAEYKELAADNKKLQQENERLKKILAENKIDPDKELTAEEKQQVEDLKNQIQQARGQLQEMKTKLEEARPEADKQEIKEKEKEKEETEPAAPQNEVQNTTPTKVDNSSSDNSFNEFCSAITNRFIKDRNAVRLNIEKDLSYKLNKDKMVSEITSINNITLANSNFPKNKSIEDYIQSADIFTLLNLNYPEFNTSLEEIATKLYVDIEKVTYAIKISNDKMKIKKSSKKIANMTNHPHLALMEERIKQEKIKKGVYNVEIVDQQFNLEYLNEQQQSETLKKYSNSIISNFSKK